MNGNIAIDENELTFKFIRASGPGGQNLGQGAGQWGRALIHLIVPTDGGCRMYSAFWLGEIVPHW